MKGISWATLVSIGVHGALMAAVLHAPPGWFAEGPPAEPIAIEIINEDVTAPEPQEEAPAPPRPPDEIAPPPEDPRLASSVIQPRIDPIEPGPIDQNVDPGLPEVIELPSVTPEVNPAVVDPEADRRRIAALINPIAAAHGGFRVTGPGPSRRGGPAGLGSTGRGAMTEAEAETQHNGFLRRQAMSKAWITHEPPELRRQADGSYRYSGSRLSATIRPDGDVVFEVAGNVQPDGFSASGSFDLTDAIMGSAGQDPHAAERDWFMRNTRELRERLETAYRAQEMASGLRRLGGRLAGIWRNTRRSATSRRRALFNAWDEMSDGSSGAEGRGIVIGFIRDTLPAGSEDAYSDAELARLNAARESAEPFDPY